MDNQLQNINKENLIPKIKTPIVSYLLIAIIIFLIIMTFCILLGVNLTSFGKSFKSIQEIANDAYTILFFSLLVVTVCILFLPNLKEFKELFQQISNVTYLILYTIFAALFYTMMSKDIMNDYYYIINPLILGLGIFSFYKATITNYVEKFNIGYEKIKMLIILFCLITFTLTFYNLKPIGIDNKYLNYSLLFNIILAVFALLYVIILIAVPSEESNKQFSLFANLSSFSVYGTLLFILFLIGTTFYTVYYKKDFLNNKTQTTSVLILILITSILWTLLLTVNSTNPMMGVSNNANFIDLFKKSLFVLFGLVASGILLYWITHSIENLTGKTSVINFILILSIIVIALGLIYKFINLRLPYGNSNKNAFFNIILNIIFYIPCLVNAAFDMLSKQTLGETNASSIIMLIISVILIIAYFKAPTLISYIINRDGKQLLSNPVYTNSEHSLGNYIELNGSDESNYQYSISCWVFINAAPPNTSSSYNKFTSLLNFGNKPNIQYNAKENTLMITVYQKDLKNLTKNNLIDFDSEGNRIIYINKNFPLQKWNNIIINYNGGTMDIILNGVLVKSTVEVIPYNTLDKLTVGENKGIKGGMCNVVYFRRPLTSSNIYYLYNFVKDKNPPVLDS